LGTAGVAGVMELGGQQGHLHSGSSRGSMGRGVAWVMELRERRDSGSIRGLIGGRGSRGNGA
jgi:hypothetical protein